MAAYENMDPGIAGMQCVLDVRSETGIAAVPIPKGVPVFGVKGATDNKVYLLVNNQAKLALSADLVADNGVTIPVNGEDSDAVAFDTDHATTMAAVVAALNAMDGVTAELDASDTNGRTIIVTTGAEACEASGVVTGGDSQATISATSQNDLVFRGISQFTQKEPGPYAVGEAVNIVVKGRVWAVVDDKDAATGDFIPACATATGFALSGLEVGARFRSAVAACGDLFCAEVEL